MSMTATASSAPRRRHLRLVRDFGTVGKASAAGQIPLRAALAIVHGVATRNRPKLACLSLSQLATRVLQQQPARWDRRHRLGEAAVHRLELSRGGREAGAALVDRTDRRKPGARRAAVEEVGARASRR